MNNSNSNEDLDDNVLDIRKSFRDLVQDKEYRTCKVFQDQGNSKRKYLSCLDSENKEDTYIIREKTISERTISELIQWEKNKIESRIAWVVIIMFFSGFFVFALIFNWSNTIVIISSMIVILLCALILGIKSKNGSFVWALLVGGIFLIIISFITLSSLNI